MQIILLPSLWKGVGKANVKTMRGPLGFGVAVLAMAGFISLAPWAKAQTLSDAQAASSPSAFILNGHLAMSYYQLKGTPFLYYLQTTGTLFNWTTPNNFTLLSSVDAGNAWLNTVSDPVPIGSAFSRFLRMQIIDPTQITDFLFPPTNLSVSLPPGPTNAALVWSDNSEIETGYAILRQSGGSGFQQIATVRPDVTTYNDYSVQGSATYTYEVVAIGQFEQSAPSNQVGITTLLDSNSDGIADIYKPLYGIDPDDGTPSTGGSGLPDGWLVEYGLNPQTVTDATEDLIGKGWSLAQDYAAGTNPNMVDTDGDGIPDSIDEYPLDPLRSQDVSAPPIAVLNISGTSGAAATTGVENIALDDQGNATFGFGQNFNSYAGEYANYEVYLWQSGTLSLAQSIVTVTGSFLNQTLFFVNTIDANGNALGQETGPDGTPPSFISQGESITNITPPNPPYAGWLDYPNGYTQLNGSSTLQKGIY